MISNDLLTKTFAHFDKFKNHSDVVNPSLPILYFGDLDAYKKSRIKVLTVGKNPSDNEFRRKKTEAFSFVRFSNWVESERNLVSSLNPYFDNIPLQWFSCFEQILNGLSASYYKDKQENIAIHTDICSPLATNPTWSKLSKQTQEALFKEGFAVWQDLIEELQPDIMLVSIPKKLFDDVFRSTGQELVVFDKTKDGRPRKKLYVVELYKYRTHLGSQISW